MHLYMSDINLLLPRKGNESLVVLQEPLRSPISAKQPWGRMAPANNNATIVQPIHNIIDIQHIASQQHNTVALTEACLHEHL